MGSMELAPRLWLQGAELTITGGSGSTKQASICAEFSETLRWVQITAFGWPVEPEVSRYFAWSVGTAVASAAGPLSSSAKAMSPGRGFFEAITGSPAKAGAERPSANR